MSKNEITLGFTGDLSITGIFFEVFKQENELFSPEIASILNKNDFNIVNLEGPATEKELIHNQNLNVRNPQHSIKYLAQRNINIFNLSNNHIFDAGYDGLKDSITEILTNKCNYFGASYSNSDNKKFIIIEKNDIKIALVGISFYQNYSSQYIQNDKNYKDLIKVCNEAKQAANWVVLNYHAGYEYTAYPDPFFRKRIKELTKCKSIDVIICHHSHYFQGFENIYNKLVFYSLGNFIFDIKPHRSKQLTKQAGIVVLNFSKDNITFKIYPTVIDNVNGVVNIGNSKNEKYISEISQFDHYYFRWFKASYDSLFGHKGNKVISEGKPPSKKIFAIIKNKEILVKIFSAAIYLVLSKIKKY